MSTPSCQTLTPNRIVVFKYEVLEVFVCKSDTFFLVHPVVTEYDELLNCVKTSSVFGFGFQGMLKHIYMKTKVLQHVPRITHIS